jgi:site-specific DNA-methyltransferase (adenine-specific)
MLLLNDMRLKMLNLSLSNYSKLSFNTNALYYGDNLEILRHKVPTESIDLIYLDPPFNSQADYNILFKESTGEQSTAQVQAFSDFWHWNSEARHAYQHLAARSFNETVSKLAQALHDLFGPSDMLAYLAMMGVRLFELQSP